MSEFTFENIIIKTVIAHTIKAKIANENTEPITTSNVINLDQEVKALFQVRLSEALGNTSHGVQMDIERNLTTDPIHLISEIILKPDENFINHSIKLAHNLQAAHTNPAWPGGVMIVLKGTIGSHDKNFVAIIKAETDKGLTISSDNGESTLKLVKDMLLSQSQRLYKVAMIVENSPLNIAEKPPYSKEHFLCFLFDHMLTRLETGRAAAYFYNTFMGMSIRTSDAKYTQIFFDESQAYINKNNSFTDEQKSSYRETLRSTLRDNTPSINLEDFAEKTFPEEIQQEYIDHLRSKNFPDRSVMKDSNYIKNKLRKPRTTTMTSGVKILVPSDSNPNELVRKISVENNKTTFEISGLIQSEDIS